MEFAMSLATFKATSRSLGGMKVENQVRDFRVIMDEPVELGGTDEGMNPVEALLSALGSCQVIVANAFAKSQGIDLQDFWVELEGDLDTDGFLKGAAGVRPGFQEVRFTMHIKTSSPPEKVEAFQRFIEARCPVGDTLCGTIVSPSRIVIEK
jgi:uncharacterized OsmC-like protein